MATPPRLARRPLLAGALLAPAAVWAQGTREITLYAYHLKPPYLLDPAASEGLYVDFASLLTLRAPGLRFRVRYLPRRRIDQELAAGRLDGLVLGVHPSWFRDSERRLYLWSPPFMSDADIVVSRHEKPIPYVGPESLAGLRLALPRGYYYAGVNELIAEGRAQREESESEETALMMLSLGRADASILTRRTLYALLERRPGLRDRFHVAAQAHDEYERHVLLPREFAPLQRSVNEAVSLLVRDPAWQSRLLER
jgi:polar amino acid transport system substrate-binding protein